MNSKNCDKKSCLSARSSVFPHMSTNLLYSLFLLRLFNIKVWNPIYILASWNPGICNIRFFTFKNIWIIIQDLLFFFYAYIYIYKFNCIDSFAVTKYIKPNLINILYLLRAIAWLDEMRVCGGFRPITNQYTIE